MPKKKMYDDKAVLDTEQLAERWGLDEETLESYRSRGTGPEFFKIGEAAQSPVRYRLEAVQEFELSRTRSKTNNKKD